MKMPKYDIEDTHSNDSNNNHFSSSSFRGCKSVSADTNNPIDTSRKEDSPLRIALADKPANSMLANPLLTASLNSPPVNLSANGSVDLSSHANLRQQRLQPPGGSGSNPINSHDNNDRNNTSSPDGQNSPSSSTCSKEMYANLLMQLRHQGVSTAASASSNDAEVSISSDRGSNPANGTYHQQSAKLSAAARKEKLKSQLCFSCPVCKKRFQRHIAMNAHFQAEHLGSTGSNPSAGDKICKLCSYIGQDMVAIRNHLLTKHNIDLETPTACLVEPEYSRSASPASCITGNGNSSRSGNSSPLPSSSSDGKKLVKSQSQNSGVAVSIIRTSVVPKSTISVSAIEASSSTSSVVVKNENCNTSISRNFQNNSDEIVEEAKDLSIKKTLTKRSASPSSQGGLDLVQNNNRKRLKTGNGNRTVIQSQQSSTAPNSPLSNQDHVSSPSLTNFSSQWQCQHCNIIFPDQTLYFLHRGFHSGNGNPWKCNGCGQRCTDMYDFNAHLMSEVHH